MRRTQSWLLVLLLFVAVSCQKKKSPPNKSSQPNATTTAPTPHEPEKTRPLSADDLKVGLRLTPASRSLVSGERRINFTFKAPDGLFKPVALKDYKGKAFTHVIKYAIPGYRNQQFVTFEFSRYNDMELPQRVLVYHRNQGERVHTSKTLPKNAIGVVAALRRPKPKKPLFIGHFIFRSKKEGVDLHCHFRITTMVYETFGQQITEICESVTIKD